MNLIDILTCASCFDVSICRSFKECLFFFLSFAFLRLAFYTQHQTSPCRMELGLNNVAFLFFLHLRKFFFIYRIKEISTNIIRQL